MGDPNPNDPLVYEIAELFIKDKAKHDANAREMTMMHATGWGSARVSVVSKVTLFLNEKIENTFYIF